MNPVEKQISELRGRCFAADPEDGAAQLHFSSFQGFWVKQFEPKKQITQYKTDWKDSVRPPID